MPPCPPYPAPPWSGSSADGNALQQQIATLTEINRRLVGESLVLRQKLDALMDQSAEQTIAGLREEVSRLTLENAHLSEQLARQRAEQAQMMTRLEDEIDALQALVAHQQNRLKDAFGAGLFGEPVVEA